MVFAPVRFSAEAHGIVDAATAKAVAEGAGALAYAALEQLEPGPPTVAVVSGGTIDPHLLASLLS